MTYTVSSGTLNSTIPYHTIPISEKLRNRTGIMLRKCQKIYKLGTSHAQVSVSEKTLCILNFGLLVSVVNVVFLYNSSCKTVVNPRAPLVVEKGEGKVPPLRLAGCVTTCGTRE